MCDLQPENIANAIREIFMDNNLNPVETPETSEQLRALLLKTRVRSKDDVDKILGCASIQVDGGRRRRLMRKTRKGKGKRRAGSRTRRR